MGSVHLASADTLRWLARQKRVEAKKLGKNIQALSEELGKMVSVKQNIEIPASVLADDSGKSSEDRLTPYINMLLDEDMFPVVTMDNRNSLPNNGYVAFEPEGDETVRLISRRFGDAVKELSPTWKISIDRKDANVKGTKYQLIRVTHREKLDTNGNETEESEDSDE